MTIDTFELRKKRFRMLNDTRDRRYQNLARPLDQVVFSTGNVVAARFQCGRDDPRFRASRAFDLCRVCRECTGMTLHDFRLEIRLRTGLERLADASADITRIALDLGFSSHSHFSSVVKQKYGSTPRSLRAALA